MEKTLVELVGELLDAAALVALAELAQRAEGQKKGQEQGQEKEIVNA